MSCPADCGGVTLNRVSLDYNRESGLGMKLQFFLYVIILGLIINLVANRIWKYIPGTNRYLDKIVTGGLVGIYILLLIFYKEEDRKADPSQQKIEIGAHSTGVHSNIRGTQIIATHSNVTVGSSANDLTSKPCVIEAKIFSDVVSRVFFRDAFSCERGEQTLYPTSQELFYEWQVLLSVNDNARDISLELHQLQGGDVIAIHPASIGVLSEPSEQWYSGFPEPHRSKPDYLLRTVRFPYVSPLTSAPAVKIRRFLAKPLISSNGPIRIKNAIASNCQVKIEDSDQAKDAKRLQLLAINLAENIYRMSGNGEPVPIRSDPGDITEHETQSTIEMRCQNDSCTEMNAGNLESRIGKPLYQYTRERDTEMILQLKKDLSEFFPCINGPYDDTHPAQDAQVLEICGEPVTLSPEKMQGLHSVLEKYGLKLDLSHLSQSKTSKVGSTTSSQ